MTLENETKLDVVVFGATGFTGKYTVFELAKLVKERGSLKWGIAGRSRDKLEKLVVELCEKTGPTYPTPNEHVCELVLVCTSTDDKYHIYWLVSRALATLGYHVVGDDLRAIPVLVADLSDEASLKDMAGRTRLVINCAGPYRLYGEPVVKACVAAGAHHVDVSGEPQYMEQMQLDYHDKAKEKGVYVVSACGFDSIPADLGTVFLTKKFEGDVNSVETYLEWRVKKDLSGPVIHYGTFESVVYGLAHARELRPLREKLFPKRLPQMLPKQKPRSLVHKSEVVHKWCMPFPGADRSVVLRSQRHFFEYDKARPVQVQAYVAFQSLLAVVGVILVGGVVGILSRTGIGRKLLLKFPGIFTGGLASHEGPSEEVMENTEFSLTLRGEGWPDKLAEPTDQHKEPPTKTLTVKVTGTNPGYGATCTMLVLSALTVLNETDKLPAKGGVYPPGAAFAKTSLIEELDKHGVRFQVCTSE